MDREDSSIERGGAANTLLCFFCSVISPHQGEGEVSGIPPRNGGLSSFPALPCPGGAPPPRFAAAPSCRMEDCGRMGRGTAVPPDKLALATGMAAWGPRWRAGALSTASAPPSLRLWGRRCNLSLLWEAGAFGWGEEEEGGNGPFLHRLRPRQKWSRELAAGRRRDGRAQKRAV